MRSNLCAAFAAFAGLVALSPVAAPAQEGCYGAGQGLLHCTLKGGRKTLDVCLQGNVGYYRFGPTGGAAELILAQKVEEIALRPWNGVGSSIYEELDFWAGDTIYQVHYAVDRIAAEEPEITGGVTVFRSDQLLAELSCDKGSVISGEFYPLYQAKERAGQCYNRDRYDWGPC